MSNLPQMLSKVHEIFSKDGLVTPQGTIKAKELFFKLTDSNGILTLDFLNTLPEVIVTKNVVITNLTITLKLTKIDFLPNNEMKLYFDEFPYSRNVKYD